MSGIGEIGENLSSSDNSGSNIKGPSVNPSLPSNKDVNCNPIVDHGGVKSDLYENYKNHNVKDKFDPERNDDNMMAENDPVRKQPENWQAEAKKGRF